jgi:hypothetical protein
MLVFLILNLVADGGAAAICFGAARRRKARSNILGLVKYEAI